EYLSSSSPHGVGPLLHRAVERSRSQAEARERAEVAAEVADLVERTGLPVAEVARRIGTSRSRLSTYRSGRVVPSATLVVRLRALVDRLADQP
ncbi:MAG: helix-turn-helix domain-containing protein, partial [Phycicoccus sp.]